MDNLRIFFLALLLAIISECYGYSCKKYYSYNVYNFNSYYYIYCVSGCCGTTYSRYCCASGVFGTGEIVGVVIGMLVAIAICIFFWVYCVKYRVKRGRVITTSVPTTVRVSTVTTGPTGVQYNNQTVQPAGPPPYNPYPAAPPPSYDMSSSTYPPPPPPQYTTGMGPAYPPPQTSPFNKTY